jgi:hypothetical protein
MSNKRRALDATASAFVPTPRAKRTKLASGEGNVSAAPVPKKSKDSISSTVRKDKGKAKESAPAPILSTLIAEEVDFPRGGGTSFTPLEVKKIRAEGLKEADEELFKVRCVSDRSPKRN